MEKIGAMVRFHRKKAGLSQVGLAKLSGLGKTAVFDLEKGKLTVQLETLLRIMKVLNIRVEFHSQLMDLFERQLDEES